MSVAFYPQFLDDDTKGKTLALDLLPCRDAMGAEVLKAIAAHSRHQIDWVSSCKAWYCNATDEAFMQIGIDSMLVCGETRRFGCAYIAFDLDGLKDWRAAVQMKNAEGVYEPAAAWTEIEAS